MFRIVYKLYNCIPNAVVQLVHCSASFMQCVSQDRVDSSHWIDLIMIRIEASALVVSRDSVGLPAYSECEQYALLPVMNTYCQHCVDYESTQSIMIRSAQTENNFNSRCFIYFWNRHRVKQLCLCPRINAGIILSRKLFMQLFKICVWFTKTFWRSLLNSWSKIYLNYCWFWDWYVSFSMVGLKLKWKYWYMQNGWLAIMTSYTHGLIVAHHVLRIMYIMYNMSAQ